MESWYRLAAMLMVLYNGPSKTRTEGQVAEAIITASTVVTTLEKLNTSSVDAVYIPINDEELRLVRIHAGSGEAPITCSLTIVSQDEKSNYEALSYVWGDQGDCKVILLNGMTWHITKNLHYALSHIRHPKSDRTVWIDALCINQSDISERAAQVTRMHSIYSRAACTLVCVAPAQIIEGHGDECVSVLFGFVEDCLTESHGEVTDNKKVCERLTNSDMDLRIKIGLGLTYILLLPYWHRVWVFQEIAYSHNADIIYGTYCIPYTTFIRFLPDLISIAYSNFHTCWDTLATRLERVPLTLLKNLPFLKREMETLFLPLATAHCGTSLAVSKWIEYAHNKLSTDPRDKIFGFYNCFPTEIKQQLNVDYSKNLSEVLIELMPLLFKEAKTLDIIFRRKGMLGQHPDIPSWVWTPESFDVLARQKSTRPRIEIPLIEAGNWKASGSLPWIFGLSNNGSTLHMKGKTVYIVKSVAPSIVAEQKMGEDKLRELMADEKGHKAIILNHFRQLWETFDPRSGPKLIEFIEAFHLENPTEMTLTSLLLWIANIMPIWQLSIPAPLLYTFDHCGRSMFSCINANNETSEREEDVSYGLGSSDMVPGDRICVLQGCSVPVILRQVGECHILISDAKVPNIMSGQAVKQIEEGSEEPEEYLIK